MEEGPVLDASDVLFPPWRPEAWRRVDDSVRGGASKSYLEYWKPSDAAVFGNGCAVVFRGLLDTTVLGGAGFASQKRQFSPPLDLSKRENGSPTSGLRLWIYPVSRAEKAPSDFVVTLKTQAPPPPSQPKPRSQLVYESTFVAPLPQMKDNVEKRDTKSAPVSIFLPFDSFVPTFRGRPVPRKSPQWQKMDLSHVQEVGIMCRSEFGAQQGNFELVLERIEVETSHPPSTSWRTMLTSLLCIN